ncbi:MAG TPA: TonB-dependent receptor [Phenylobacterium sp.]|jgi:catecholate siderophore receptor|uniref:TonB-dependent receptor n=1 Tax=Phenylobacterium sp. TaxID=1871053 RepID=UPI002B652FCC|nr:TonB-dependent receptor [Phenylobacterium sp.]HXA38260.1 TonB-dependent receptor [Phenylobacterium sp.]
MRGGGFGVVGYRKARPVRLGLATMAGAAGLCGAAHAAELAAGAADAADAATVSGLTVNGEARALDRGTGLSVLTSTVQDTPQAISVVTQAQLKAQGINSLEGALRNVPGITIAIGEGGTLSGDQFKIRGFDAKDDVYVDGLRDFGAYTRDSFNYEEVQVLKGPSGAMFGRGTTGGAINTISKAPKLDDFTSLDGYVGDGRYYRALADIDRKFGDTAAARLTLMANSTGVVDRDLIYSDRWGAALAVGWGLGTDTQATASYLHQHDHQRPDYGVVIVQKPGDLIARPATEYGVGVSRSNFLGFRNDIDRSDTDMLTVRLSHRVNDKVTFTSDTRYAVYSRYFQYTTLDQCNAACTTALFDGDPATEPFGGIGGQGPYQMDAWGLQNISAARIDDDLGRWKNQAIVGVDVSRQVNDKQFFTYLLPAGFTTRPAIPHPIVNPDPNFPTGYAVFRAVPGQTIACPSLTANCTTTVNGATVFTNTLGTATEQSHGASTDAAIFLTDRLWLTETLSVIASYRLDRYTADLDSTFFNNATSNLKVKPTLKSPRASVVWEPAADRTFYLSWGRSQTPQGTSVVGAAANLTVTARDLAPEDSEIWEAGVKFALPGTRLSATGAVFDIRKDNALQTDPATGFLQAQSGERQEVKGVELGLTGKLTSAWTISAGYTYLDDRIKQSFATCAVPTVTAGTPAGVVCPAGVTAALPVLNTVAVGRQVTFTPKNAATLFTTYDASRWIDGLSVGGDVTYQSRLFLGYTARSVSFTDRSTLTALRIAEAPENLTLDAFVSYRAGHYRFAVNGYNLADRLNYSQVFGTRATPAAGRTIIVSVGATF